MPYRSPVQARGIDTLEKFLESFDEILSSKGYNGASIQEISDAAGLTKAAFLARFKTKKNALLLLFDRYCAAVSQEMSAASLDVVNHNDAKTCIYDLSYKFEKHLTKHFSSNRAMHEIFLAELKVDERTQKIFCKLVDLMRRVQEVHLTASSHTDNGAFFAAQILVTVNYNYVLQAMPAMPRETSLRHALIAQMVTEALKF